MRDAAAAFSGAAMLSVVKSYTCVCFPGPVPNRATVAGAGFWRMVVGGTEFALDYEK